MAIKTLKVSIECPSGCAREVTAKMLNAGYKEIAAYFAQEKQGVHYLDVCQNCEDEQNASKWCHCSDCSRVVWNGKADEYVLRDDNPEAR